MKAEIAGRFLNIVRIEFVAQPLAGLQFRVFDFGVELIDRDDFYRIVQRDQQIEIDGVIDRGFHNIAERFLADGLGAEIVVAHADLAFSFDEILHFPVDENTSDQVSFVGAAIVFERIGQKVIDVDDAAVRVGFVFGYVGILPDDVFPVEFEDIGVHAEDQDVIGHMQLGLEFPAVPVFDPHIFLSASFESVVQIGGKFVQ